MKRLFNYIFVIIAAMVTFAGCEMSIIDESVAPETKTVQFYANSIETKTAFGTPDGTTYPTLWTENDKSVKLLLNLNEEFTPVITVADDFKTASFNTKVTLDSNDPSTAPYTFYAMSPASAYLGKNAERYSATIPTGQTPLDNSVDEAAQILYAVSEEFAEIPTTVNLNFKHFTAYGKLSFVNLELGDAKVTSVAISSTDVYLAGRWNYVVVDGTFTENAGVSEITLDTDKTENLWFACAPVGSMDGKKLKFTVNTDKGPISKEVTLSGDKYNFTAGHIANMKLDMKGITFAESKVYELVTDANDLTVDSKIIIVARDYDYALGTTQNNNNRAQAAVTKNENKIENPGDAVQVITVEEGTSSGSLAFNVGNGYLYAASSSSNYLKTEETLSDNSSWNVSIVEEIATIKAQGTNTRNWLRYNSNNNPPIFSCYGSGQTDVCIYKLQGSGTAPLPKLTAPVVTAELNDDETGINVSWTSVENATSYTVSCTGKEDQVVTDTECSFDDLSAGSYVISVTANAEGYKSAIGESNAVVVPSAGGEGESDRTPAATPCYVLSSDIDAGSNNSYAGNCDITVGDVIWNLTGNSQTNPWRIGGKNLTAVDRTLYSKTAYPSALSKIEFISGTASSVTWNSLTLKYSTSPDFNNSYTIVASEVGASKTISFEPEDGFPANCYYKFILNVTIPGNSNRYVQVSDVKFYGYEN